MQPTTAAVLERVLDKGRAARMPETSAIPTLTDSGCAAGLHRCHRVRFLWREPVPKSCSRADFDRLNESVGISLVDGRPMADHKPPKSFSFSKFLFLFTNKRHFFKVVYRVFLLPSFLLSTDRVFSFLHELPSYFYRVSSCYRVFLTELPIIYPKLRLVDWVLACSMGYRVFLSGFLIEDRFT